MVHFHSFPLQQQRLAPIYVHCGNDSAHASLLFLIHAGGYGGSRGGGGGYGGGGELPASRSA
jgi:hypothetical protein